MVLIGSVGFVAGGHIGSEAMPDIEGDVLEARLLFPQGTPLARTQAAAAQLEAALRRLDAEFRPAQPGGAPLVEAIQTRFNHHPSARESGPQVATVMVDLLAAEDRSVDLDSLADLAEQTIQLPTGERGPLDAVASVREQRDWARITRIDGQRTVRVQAEVDARQASGQAIVADLKARWLSDFQARHPEVPSGDTF